MAKHEYGSKSHWNAVLISEFEKESDRAAVILTASLFDNALAQLIAVSLVASPSSTDELLYGANAPLSTFSARINLAYRVGLISRKFCRDLHLVRSIRNSFAHNVHGCGFDESSVKSRVLELSKSSGLIERNPKFRASYPVGTRGDFLFSASWMLWSLNTKIESAHSFEEAEVEMGYDIRNSEESESPSEDDKII
jgi:DNA-binding MltR family transcriptional regulator